MGLQSVTRKAAVLNQYQALSAIRWPIGPSSTGSSP